MTVFLRLLAEQDKGAGLATACTRLCQGEADPRRFEVAPEAFDVVPGKPFAYWVSDAVRETFRRLPPFEGDGRAVRVGLQTGDDFRFVRGWWEVDAGGTSDKWFSFAKGGTYSPFYADVYLVVNWAKAGAEICHFVDPKTAKLNSRPQNTDFYFRPGLTWPLRARSFAPQAMPAGCIFSVRGYCAFPENSKEAETLAIFNSSALDYLYKTALGRFGFPEFIVGILQIMPWADATAKQRGQFETLARRAWSLKRTLDTTTETSHAFLLPAALQRKECTTEDTEITEQEEGNKEPNTTLSFSVSSVSSVVKLFEFDPPTIEAELSRIQAEIDTIAFDLYGFSEADRIAALSPEELTTEDTETTEEEEEKEIEFSVSSVSSVVNLSSPASVVNNSDLLSWCVGVAFGRFDWRLATGEREPPPEPDPFDPLPAKSPGMLPDGAEPLHPHPSILVDDPDHPHDLAHLVDEVLARVDITAPNDVRRWLHRDFFPFHLQRYSKSRRKAPIYWPLATASGSYTLWVYYPSLGSQTLYTVVNDFVEPRLKQVGSDLTALRNKGSARTRDDERRFESLQAFELELIELRDTLLRLAPSYKPNQDDGVQITAAPLWPLFRHKPWQKVLKDTWEKLSKGDYDWAHLAMNYRPERVREKCKTDKSLAIAHGLEDLYVEPAAKPKGTRGRKKTSIAGQVHIHCDILSTVPESDWDLPR